LKAYLTASQKDAILEKFPIILFCGSILWGISTFQLASIPGEAGSNLLWGFSLERLILLAASAMAALANLLAGILILFRPIWKQKLYALVTHVQAGAALRRMVFIAASLCALSLLVLRFHQGGNWLSYYDRLAPLLFAFLLEDLLIWLSLCLIQLNFYPSSAASFKPILNPSMWIAGFFALLWILIKFTGWGITPENHSAWGYTTSTLLEWQLLVVALVAVLALRKTNVTGEKTSAWIEIAIVIGIWLAAAVFWSLLPTTYGHYAPPPVAPNYEVYPYSDAGIYDLNAQFLLRGGFPADEIPPKPFYSFLLAVFHALAGQNYDRTVFVQTLLLAWIPAALYLIGARLHSRLAGILVSLLAIFREWNSIQATPHATYIASVKLMLTDIPTLLSVVLFCVLLIDILQSTSIHWWKPIAAGGIIGLATMMRSQSLLLAPAAFLFMLLIEPRNWKRWLTNSLLIGFGLFLALFPWLWRNHQATGNWAIDDPGWQPKTLAERYSFDEKAPPRLEGENDGAYAERMMATALEFARQQPAYVAQFITNHTINNHITSLLVLPVRDQITDLRSLLLAVDPFWQRWNGRKINSAQAVMLAFYLCILSIGIGASWKKARWMGILPLAIHVAYIMSIAIARRSGWRFVLPTDWVVYFYFVVGMLECLVMLRTLFGLNSRRLNPLPARNANSPSTARQAATTIEISAALLLAGCAMPFSASIFPTPPPPPSREEIIAEILRSAEAQTPPIDTTRLEQFLYDENTILRSGNAFYPRFYREDDGMPTADWDAFEIRDFPRLGFILFDQSWSNAVFPVTESPSWFPNNAEILVATCKSRKYVDVRLVLVKNNPSSLYLSSSPLQCSP
jgi:hypothetical protein